MLPELQSIITRTTARTVRTLLWQALVKVDSAFAFHTTSAQVSIATPASQVNTSLPERPVPEVVAARAIVVNENSAVGSVDALRLVLLCMFERVSLGATLDALFAELASKPEIWGNHDSLTSFVREHLVGRCLDPTLSVRSEAAHLLAQLAVHEEKTEASRRAYLPAGRENPDAVFWPDPSKTKSPRSLFTELPFAKSYSFVDKAIPIGSAGSCFAMEIAHRLQAEKFNYVTTEPYPHAINGYSNACARWGDIFNTPSFRQLVEKAFGRRTLPKLLWSLQRGEMRLRDPYREDIAFASVEEFEADFEPHLRATREALLRCKVFVLTLGMNEVWRLKSDGTVFSRAPWKIAANLVEQHTMTVEENVNELQAMIDLWRTYNPDIKFIVSVSPVPLHATFRGDTHHVITANAHSKAVLRVAAGELVARNRDVFYFPSYEVVMHCTKDAWDKDQRHVSRHAVDNVMRLFNRMFLTTSALEATPYL